MISDLNKIICIEFYQSYKFLKTDPSTEVKETRPYLFIYYLTITNPWHQCLLPVQQLVTFIILTIKKETLFSCPPFLLCAVLSHFYIVCSKK